MDLFEYQARDLFAAHGVPVLDAIVATTPDEAESAAQQLGGELFVVKAQVKTGGRGKAGGVKLAKSPQEAREHAAAILGMDIKGHTVHRVLVAKAADIAEEYYFSVLLDRANRSYLSLAERRGRHGDRSSSPSNAPRRSRAIARQRPGTGIDKAKAVRDRRSSGSFSADLVEAAGERTSSSSSGNVYTK